MKINIVGKKIQMRKKTVIFLTAALILFFSAIGYIMSVSTTFQIEDFEDPLENETEPMVRIMYRKNRAQKQSRFMSPDA